MGAATGYVLGATDAEIARLDAQAQMIAPATHVLLQASGIGHGMRVLDLGTGLGHVALAVARLVGPAGAVVGIDQAAPMVRVAERRARDGGLVNVRFEVADVRGFRDEQPFDAIVCRLLLFHLPDRVEVLRRHLRALRPGGLLVALDFDIGSSRAEPDVALLRTLVGWVEAAFRAAGADPRVGARLGVDLRDAGAADVTGFGVQPCFGPDDARGPAMLGGVVRSLAGQIAAAGIATPAEIGADSVEARIAAALTSAGAVMLPPALMGAWGRRPA